MTNDKDECFSKAEEKAETQPSSCQEVVSVCACACACVLPTTSSIGEGERHYSHHSTNDFELGIRIIRWEVINLHCGAAANAKNEDLIVSQPCTCARLHRSHHNLPSRWR